MLQDWNSGRVRAVWLSFLAALWIGGTAGLAAAPQVELVSRVDPSQLSDTGASELPSPLTSPPIRPSTSNDGRYVVFVSTATNLVQGQQDANLAGDVFLRDLLTGTTTLVSRSMDSPVKAGNLGSGNPVISGDGRYVVFTSTAMDLAPGQVLSDRERAYLSEDLLLYDRVTGTNSLLVSVFDASALEPAISADGRYIAFTSDAENLVPGQQQGESRSNVFLYDRVGKSFRLVSHTSASAATASGGSAPVISADGRYILFVQVDFGQSSGDRVLLYDRVSGAVTLIGPGSRAVMSSDASQIAVITDRSLDLYDRRTGERTQLSHANNPSSFFPGKPSLSTDGRFTVFISSEDDAFPGQPGGTRACFLYDRISRTYTLVSRRQGSPATARSAFDPAISGDGRFVVFASSAKDIVSGQTDTDSSSDIFLFNRTSGTTKLVSRSIASASTTGNARSYDPAISANGSAVVFVSQASDLEIDLADLNDAQDAFTYEISFGMNSAITRRAPETPSFSPLYPSYYRSAAWALSADGRWVAFESYSSHLVPGQVDPNRLLDVFLYDRITKAVILVSRSNNSASRTANGQSVSPGISADGRYVVYASLATDIVPGTAGPSPEYKIFLFDRIAGTNRLVARTASTDRSEFPESPMMRISPDGRWVAFTSHAPDLVPGQQEQPFLTSDVFLWDRDTGSTILVSRSSTGETIAGNRISFAPHLSSDGRYIAFSSWATDLVPGQIEGNDPNPTTDLFLYDRATGRTVQVSPVGEGPFVSMSADGRFIAFSRSGADDREVLLYDRALGANQLIASQGTSPRISADGRYVAFLSEYSMQVYLYDRISQAITLVTRSSVRSDDESNGYARSLAISADGRYIAFVSDATDLIPGQISAPDRDDEDVFLFDRITGTTTLVSRSKTSSTMAVGFSKNPLLSASGRQVAFTSSVDIAEGDFNLLPDAFLFSLDAPPGGPVPLPPCTLLDTRRAADSPALRSDVRRTLTVARACGVPAAAKKVSVKVTALQPSGKGNLRFYPGNVPATSQPSATLRFEKGQTRTASFTLSLATNGAGTLAILPFVAGKGTVHAIVEVNGYSE